MNIRYVGDQYDYDLQQNVLAAAATVEAVIQVPLSRHLAVVGRAENLLDVWVETRNQGGWIDLGTPRTLWVGIRPN